MHTIRHIMETVGLLALIGILAFLPAEQNESMILSLCGIGILGILLFLGIYLYHGRKTGLFIWLIVFCCLPHTATAGRIFRDDNVTDQLADEYVAKLDKTGPDICKSNESFDPEGKNPPEMLDEAFEYIDMYDQLGANDVGWGATLFGTGRHNYYDCAHELKEKGTEWQKRQTAKELKTVPMLLEEERGRCWPCGIVDMMLEAVEKTVFSVEDFMKTTALILLGLMTLFWLAFYVLTFIGKLGTGGQSDFMTDIATRLFVVLCVAVILQAPLVEFYRITLSPLISIGTTITQQITAIQLTSSPAFSENFNKADVLGCSCCTDSGSNCNDAANTERNIKKSTVRLLDEADRAGLLCTTCRIYKQTLPFIASGQLLIRYSFKNKTVISELASKATGGKTDKIPYPLPMYILGIIIVVVFTLLAFWAAFRLMDIFIRLGFVFVLMPLLITAYAFPISRQYAKTGWNFFVHAILSMIALSIGMALVLLMFTSFLPGDAESVLVPAMIGETEGGTK